MRFKELRGLLLAFLLLIMDILLVVTNLDDKMKLMAAVFLSFMILMSFVSQFYIRVLNDSIFLYRMAGIVLIPGLVEMKDIKEMILKSKYHLVLKTDLKTYHAYVFNAEKLKLSIQKNMEELNHEEN